MSDPDRAYSWRPMGSTQQGKVRVAAVTIGDREIPYEYRYVGAGNGTEEWHEVKLGAFGSSSAGEFLGGPERVKFA